LSYLNKDGFSVLPKYAVLCGSAPDGFSQKKLNDMKDFLASEEGGSWAKCGIVSFPNGVSEKTLKTVLENIKAQARNASLEKAGYENLRNELSISHNEDISEGLCESSKVKIFLYICTLSPVLESEKSVWLVGEEIRKSVIEDFAAADSDNEIDLQVVYDADREFVSDEDDVAECRIDTFSFLGDKN